MKIAAVLTLAGLGTFASVLAQTPATPADHPEKRVQARDALSDQTARLAPVAKSKTGPIVRKNFVDRYIFSKMERDGVPHAGLAGDAEFFRRVYIDLTGRIPTGDDAKAFVASDAPAKRDKLIDKLVGGEEWSERWTHYLLDLWRASQNRIGWAGRNVFHAYVQDALRFNQPFDEFVQEMIVSEARSNWYVGPSSYLVRWAQFGDNCTEIMHEDTADEMTVMLFKHFMGINLQCVSCHDGANHLEKVNVWLTERKRDELWAQAAFFGNTRVLRRVELRNTQDEYLIDDQDTTRVGYEASAKSTVRVTRQGAGLVPPKFILGGEAPNPELPLREELARIFTSHPQFARAMVNRFWAALMGVGIVDPVDDFDLSRMDPANLPEGWDLQPTHPELLEELAKEFERSGYDLQHLFRTIVKSSAYQLSASFPGEWKVDYAKYFARKFVRRLTAEQVYDAVVKATNLPTEIQIPRTDKKVKYLVQLHGPADIKAATNLNHRFKRNLQFFVESFGQANREFNDPSLDGSILQAALMMNSAIVKEKAKPVRGSFLSKILLEEIDDAAFVDRLFWRFLTRGPDAVEADESLTLLADRGRQDGGEDLQWLLMNKVEFLFQY